MAFYIEIRKLAESPHEVRYQFLDTAYPTEIGVLRLDKASGNIEVVQESRQPFFIRAATKVRKHHGLGEYPDFTEWAS